MHTGAVDTVIFVHGYSVRDLNSFNQLPSLLEADGIAATSIYLAGFISLDDYLGCEDLANALEDRIASLINTHGIDLGKTILVAHSTGAIVARRWILDRRATKKAVPSTPTLSHFLSCAGANHGSTMAQLGRTELAYLFRTLTEGQSVGKRVLQDLDYGSEFLHTLNREWLEAWNDAADPLFADTFCFSMGGTDHSFWQNHLTWQSHESGSDGTVRISGANLNYRWISVPGENSEYELETMVQQAPHLVVELGAEKYSHTSQNAPDTENLVVSAANAIDNIAHGFNNPASLVSTSTLGIVDGVTTAGQRPYTALREAMNVQTAAAYAALAQMWDQQTTAWSQTHQDAMNSTVVFTIFDGMGNLVDDTLVILRDTGGTIAGVTASLLDNQPIRNQTSPGIVSMYLNFPTFEAVHPHSVHIEARTDTPFVAEAIADAPLSSNDDHVIAANEFTYVDVLLPRDPNAAMAVYRVSDIAPAIVTQQFPPFAPGSVSSRIFVK
jgi:pimeloyl-ACP methyl ester carboxylesterase